jgi:hypothetical protein
MKITAPATVNDIGCVKKLNFVPRKNTGKNVF